MNSQSLGALDQRLIPAFDYFAPPPLLKTSDWADKFRQLSQETAADAGRWKTSRAPYQRAIMDAAFNPEVDTIVFMKSSQVGATEIILNLIGAAITNDPGPMLCVQPNIEMAIEWSKNRFDSMIRESDVFQGLIKEPRTKHANNRVLSKKFPGGTLAIIGANSPAGLASRPVRYALFDETDRYPPSAGKEGDSIALGVKRTANFWNRLIVMVSTPTIKDLSRIEAAFNESNQQYYFVPCPFCGHFQRLTWEGIAWDKSPDGEDLPETAKYTCEKCRQLWSDAQRKATIKRDKGRWIAQNPKVKHIAGFHISELYSPWASLAKIVSDYLAAKENPERLKVFYNTTLGEPYENELQSIERDDVAARREDYPAPVPAGGLCLVAGVDIQDDRIIGEVVAFGRAFESWGVKRFVLYGDPGRPDLWRLLDEQLKETFLHESGHTLKISAACIDSGGHFTNNVYKFCYRKQHRRIFAVKGSSTPALPIIARVSKAGRPKIPLVLVGTDTAKEILFSRLAIDEPGPGFLHFPDNYKNNYFDELTAEKPVLKYRNGAPVRVWQKKTARARNEALDCRVYSLAALELLNPNFEALAKSLERPPEGANVEVIDKNKKKKPRQNSWVSGKRRRF